MTCGIDNLFYEISYNVERSGLSSVTRLDSVTHTPDSVQRYEMRGLLPYTQYSVRVRVVGYVDGGDGTYMVGSGTLFGRTALLSSNFSDITVFTTNKSRKLIVACLYTFGCYVYGAVKILLCDRIPPPPHTHTQFQLAPPKLLLHFFPSFNPRLTLSGSLYHHTWPMESY